MADENAFARNGEVQYEEATSGRRAVLVRGVVMLREMHGAGYGPEARTRVTTAWRWAIGAL